MPTETTAWEPIFNENGLVQGVQKPTQTAMSEADQIEFDCCGDPGCHCDTCPEQIRANAIRRLNLMSDPIDTTGTGYRPAEDIARDLTPKTIRPSHLRVDVAGVAIYVRSNGEYQHLVHINHKLAVAKLALHRIAAQQIGASGVALKAIEDMKNV